MKKWMLLIIVLSMLSVLAACGSAAETPKNVENNPASAPSTLSVGVSKPQEEEVKDPGKLLIYSAGPGGLANKILEGFIAETGIDAEMFSGTTGAILGRLEAESANPIADVIVLASWPAAMDLKDRGLLAQYTDAANADLLQPGWNGDYYTFGYSASALGITYNTLLVDNPGLDWSDYAQQEWFDMVNVPDPSRSGSALDFVAGYISNKPNEGWDLFEAFKSNKMSVAGANTEALDPVILGAKSAVLAGVDYMAYSAKAKGEPVDIIYPTSGTVVNPRPAMILSSTQNMENAQRFIDYLLSDEVQQLVADAYLIPGRIDVPAHPDRVGYDDIPQFKIDWEWMSEHQESINERFQAIFR